MEGMDEGTVFSDWLSANQLRITTAVLSAMARIAGVSDALVDPHVAGEEERKQRVEALITSSHALLADFVAEEFGKAFADARESLRGELRTQAGSIVREDMDTYVEMLLNLARGLPRHRR